MDCGKGAGGRIYGRSKNSHFPMNLYCSAPDHEAGLDSHTLYSAVGFFFFHNCITGSTYAQFD